MAKTFRKLEVLLNGTVYVLNRAASEMLLARLDAFGEVIGDACRRLRENLRSALATETDGPAAANPFDAEEPRVDEAVTVEFEVSARGGAEGAEAEPHCYFCGAVGERAGSAVFDMWRCANKDCFRRGGSMSTRSVFAEGGR